MKQVSFSRVALVAAFFSLAISHQAFGAKPSVRLQAIGTYATGSYNQSAAEIAAYDPQSRRVFVVNGAGSNINVLDIADPTNPTLIFSIDVSPYGRQANSVDVRNGIVAAAVEANVKTDNGRVVFFDVHGNYLNDLPAGALPDMITFTPNGKKVLVANEGEPNSYLQMTSVDPEGSITIVDLTNGVANATATQVGFSAFNGTVLDDSVRIYGPGATVAQDLEPEYIAVDHTSKKAWVTLQENNAIAILDIATATVTDIVGLGFKDHLLDGNWFDASDRDVPGPSNGGIIRIKDWPVLGMYQPDGIAALKYKNETFLITANEGDARDYLGYSEEARVADLNLDAASFTLKGYPDVTNTFPNGLRHADNLGRLTVTKANGNTDADAEYEDLYVLGARSFSIWTANGHQIYDSGDDFENITAAAYPLNFNANHSCDLPCITSTGNEIDNRSDNKGPEPEGVEVGKAYGRTYAFIGLERMGGIMVYDVTNPYEPKFVQYINNRNFMAAANTAAARDLGPEGLRFVPAEDSPNGVPLLIVANEVSGTTTVYRFDQVSQ